MRNALIALGILTLGPALADAVATKIEANAPLTAAMQEVHTKGKLECEPAEHWSVKGDGEVAADFISNELESRGWPVMDHGSLELSYVLVADPDPSNDRAIAVAGLVFERGEDESYVFLEKCLTE